MSEKIIRLARWGMQAELAQIWQTCFGDARRPTYYFFNNAFQPQNCLVYQIDGKVAAMVHMLPVRLVQPGGSVQGHYIYAASTLPQYRKQGCMGALLRAAVHVGEKRGDVFSCLLPSSDALYDYYEKYNYETAFFTRFLSLSAAQLSAVSTECRRGRVVLGGARMRQLRQQQLESFTGSVLWDERALCFADEFNRQYGGRLVAVTAEGQDAYAMARYSEDGACEVTEIMAHPAALPALAGQLLFCMPAEEYRLRLPVDTVLFSGQGEVRRFGMLRPIQPVQHGQSAYLGLPLD